MIASYSNNPQLFERCINLIDEVFPGCKEFALNGNKYNASWSESSIPFIVEKNGEIIAHAGVWPLTFILNGKEHHTASIHGVCVKPEHRGQGYFKQLMHETTQFVEANFDFSVLFTVKPYLYKDFPYRAMLPEYDFVVSENIKLNPGNSDLRLLSYDNPSDLQIAHNLLTTRIPLSNQLSVKDKTGTALFVFNTIHKKVHHSDKLNALIVYEIVNNTLYLKEVVSQKQLQFNDIIESIPGQFVKIILQFCPDNFLNEKEYSPVLAGPECCIMVADKFPFSGKYFRYPELFWC